MFERRAIVLALGLAAGPAMAQRAPDSTALLRTRLAQVETQLAVREEQRQQEEARAPKRLGRIQTEGNITVLVRESVPRDTIVRLATAADSILADFGGIPDTFTRTMIQVMPFVSDTATLLAAPGVKERRRLDLDWSGDLSGSNLGDGWMLAFPVTRAFRETLDSTWQNWLGYHFGVYWKRADDGEGAINELASPDFATGTECLAGRLRSCRLWLGVDNDVQPYRVRYKADELVRATRERHFGGPDGAACRNGEGDACARIIENGQTYGVILSPVPAPEHIRASLVRGVRELHGAGAVRQALADQNGSVGERLARAAGVSEDSLMAEWRRWVLSRGRTERVSAGVGDVLTALLFTALLVGLATRSGRWR